MNTTMKQNELSGKIAAYFIPVLGVIVLALQYMHYAAKLGL